MTFATTNTGMCRPTRPARAGLMKYLDVYRSRQQLARLDDQALSDIGLTRRQAEVEAARPIWDFTRD